MCVWVLTNRVRLTGNKKQESSGTLPQVNLHTHKQISNICMYIIIYNIHAALTHRVRLTGKKREQWDCHEASVMTTSPKRKTQANQLVLELGGGGGGYGVVYLISCRKSVVSDDDLGLWGLVVGERTKGASTHARNRQINASI